MKNIVKCEKGHSETVIITGYGMSFLADREVLNGQGNDTETIKADMNNIYHNQFNDRAVKFK